MFDLEGNFVLINKALERIYGWEESELIGKKISILDSNEFENAKQALQQGEKDMQYETVIKRKDGEFYIAHTFFAVRSPEGKFTAVACISKDISDRKAMEEKAMKSYQDLLNTIRYQQGMTFKYKKINERYIHTLADGELLYRLGLTPEQVVGKDLFDFLPHEIASSKMNYCERAWNGEENLIYEGALNNVTYLASLKPIKDHNGSVVEVIASCIDISRRKQAEELLLQSEKLSVIGQLAAGVAHEIRNPLTALKGFSQLLKQKYNESHDFFNIMLSELDRINYIVNDFMILAKPQAVHFQWHDINNIIRSVIPIINTQAILNNLEIITEYDEETALIRCDENQLKQVIINLLKNAIEATPNGGTIQVTCKKQGKHILVQIIDQGPGIPPELIKKLGEPFYTTKPNGTGLGLMISYNIIEKHRGKLFFESRMNTGTIASIQLPL